MSDKRETSHRVKNHMAVINSLIRLKASSAEDDSVRQALEETGGLITAVTLVYQFLYRNEAEDRLFVSPYIRELLDILSLSTEDRSVEPEVSLPPDGYMITPEKAVPLGIMIAELVIGVYGPVSLDLSAYGEESGWRLMISGHSSSTGGTQPKLTASLVSQLDGGEEPSKGDCRIFIFPGELLFLSN